MTATLYFDGGARGTRGGPGPHGCAVVLDLGDGKEIDRTYYLGDSGTNNEAEYMGLINGLRLAYALGVREIQCFSDSRLVVEQVLGGWTINREHLRHLADQARDIASRFVSCSIRHVRREHNTRADQLVTTLLDLQTGARRGDKKRKR